MKPEYSNDVVRSIERYYERYEPNVNPNYKSLVRDVLSEERIEERLILLSKTLNLNIKKAKVLDLGSGFGSFVLVSQKKGIDCYGLEPKRTAIEVSIERLKNQRLKKTFVCAVGETMPFKNELFDLVVSYQVLEHVKNPEHVIKETLRVLKKGGYLHFVIPNYSSFWESHYGLLWFPNFPKSIAKLYVRLLGRNANFLDHIQYITPSMLTNILKKEDVEILDYGIEVWENRLKTLKFSTWGHTIKLMALAKLLKKFKLTSLVRIIGERFSLYYPIILTVRKCNSSI